MIEKVRKYLIKDKWYHGTTLDGLKKICKNGVLVNYNEGNELDFGTGFYLTDKKQKAIDYIERIIKYRVDNSLSEINSLGIPLKDNTDKNIPVILEFEFLPLQYFENEKYSTKIFNSYNEEFAKFVFQNRYHLDEKHKYDLIFGVMSDSNPMLLIQQYREKKITENEVIDGLRKSTSMKQLSIHNQELCDIIKLNKAYYLNGKELNINEYCNK
ncbi:DUF3990 domain-containing protein [Clostridium perfringens]|jgi:hypothetical protein